MLKHIKSFTRETAGAAMVEFTIIVSMLLIVTGGMVEFAIATSQWNAATKAVQLGARLASVSDPVDSSLPALSGLVGGALPGDPYPASAYSSRVCSGSGGSCTGGGTYDATAMRTLVFGRGQTTCGTIGADQSPAMCDIFPGIAPANVIVTYTNSGLGFAGRPGGPVPTITVQLQNITYSFVFLNALLGYTPITMPPLSATATGEDMKTTN